MNGTKQFGQFYQYRNKTKTVIPKQMSAVKGDFNAVSLTQAVWSDERNPTELWQPLFCFKIHTRLRPPFQIAESEIIYGLQNVSHDEHTFEVLDLPSIIPIWWLKKVSLIIITALHVSQSVFENSQLFKQGGGVLVYRSLSKSC